VKLCHLLVLAFAGACGLAPLGHATEPLRLEEAVALAFEGKLRSVWNFYGRPNNEPAHCAGSLF